ncbi:MAG: restriction endonuclease subunit M [Lachnospiraceae bacterium]|nr:restriction endonuclease subunit M [Lachnospiraceae bacterium]
MSELIDIKTYPLRDVLTILLRDKTTKQNIIWATDAYESYGPEFTDRSHISKSAITGPFSIVLQPRISKTLEEQQERTRKKAEVMTPVWLCNKMNNYADEQWFGRPDVFNHENEDNSWTVTEGPILFDEKNTWKAYVDSRRLEITCGEAPYLVSRYDTTTGELIVPPIRRIGMLDRKLRVVNENAATEDEWLKWAERAVQSCYGFEWQGDSLLLARCNVFLTYYEYYKQRWNKEPDKKLMQHIAGIISWNIWQMDGLKDTVPLGKPVQEYEQTSLFDLYPELMMAETQEVDDKAPYCRIYDWRADRTYEYRKCKERG